MCCWERAASGPLSRLCGPRLPVARPALLWDRSQGLRLARRITPPGKVELARAGHGDRSESPTIRRRGLHGGIVYTDGQFDDARLAIALARTFADLGGTALNYVTVTDFTKRNGRIVGVAAKDVETGEEIRIESRSIINAAGVYVDTLRRLDDAGSPALVTPSQGAHLVLDRSLLPGETAILVPRTDDGRVLFAIPWHGVVLVGTTDTPVTGLAIEPRPLHEEVAYLEEHVGRYLDRPVRPGRDPKHLPPGCRPLLRGRPGSPTAKLSREHAVVVSESRIGHDHGGQVDDVSPDGDRRRRPRGPGRGPGPAGQLRPPSRGCTVTRKIPTATSVP